MIKDNGTQGCACFTWNSIVIGPSHRTQRHGISRREAGGEGVIMDSEAEKLLEKLMDGNLSELSDLDDDGDERSTESYIGILSQGK